jgi:hypothetical protein
MRTPSNRTGPGYQGVIVEKPDIPNASSIGRSNCAKSPLLVLAILPLTVRSGRPEGWGSDDAVVRRESATDDVAPANAVAIVRCPKARLVRRIIFSPSHTHPIATVWRLLTRFPRRKQQILSKLQA